MTLARFTCVLALVATASCSSESADANASANDGASTGTDGDSQSTPPEDAAADTQSADTSPSDTEVSDTHTPDSRCASLASTCRRQGQGCSDDGTTAECLLCPIGEYPAGPNAACALITGERLSYDFETITMSPGTEHSGWCQSWQLNNSEELWVNAVEFISGGGYHHSNWFFVPQGKFDWPTGLWKGCYGQGFGELEAALAGGVIFAQSTQVPRETQKFPAGAAVRIPPYSRIIAATHLLNPTIDALVTDLRMTLYTLPKADVEIPLT
ncbi:MAG: hypothetical protein ACI9OJ_005470, partial [Myxococcota bacterium]